MLRLSQSLHAAIGSISYTTSQTILAASRASAHPTELDGYWVEAALEKVAAHRADLDRLEAEILALQIETQAA